MNIELAPDQIAVTLSGAVAIVFLLWYFLGTERWSARGVKENAQEIVITVRGGYEPDNVLLVRGVAAKLRFQRDEETACSEELVIPHFGIRRTLPAHKTTTIDLQPDEAGEFEFHCGKGMLRGRIVVIEA